MKALVFAALLLAGPGDVVDVVVSAHEDGAPVEGARVAAARVNGPGPFDPDAVLGGGGVVSDLGGRVHLDLPAGEGRILLAAVAPGFAPAAAYFREGDPIRISLRRAAPLDLVTETAPSGNIVAEEDASKPVPGAAVEILLAGGYMEEGVPPLVRRTRTGADGKGRVADLPRGPFLEVEVRAPGFAPARVTGVLAGGAALRVALAPAARVVGRVLRVPGGAPVGGAIVRGGGVKAMTGSDGGFALEGLVPGRVTVTAEKEGTLALDAPTVLAEAGRTAPVPDLRLADLGRVKVLVQGPDGRPVPRVRVRLLPPSSAPPLPGGPASALGGSDGAALLGPVAPAAGHRLVLEPGAPFAPRVTDAFAVLPGETVDIGAVRLDGGGVLSGEVVGPDGFPVPGAALVLFDGAEDPLRAAADPGAGGPLRRDAEVPADGKFRIERVPAGSRSLLARAPGRLSAGATRIAVAPGAEVAGIRIVLRAGAVVAGVLRGPDGGPIRDGVVVALAPVTGAEAGRARTGPDGAFRIEGLLPGASTLRVVLPEEPFPDPLRPLFPVLVPAEGIELRLPAHRVVEGVVIDPAGGPVRGQVVVARFAPAPKEVERIPLAEDGAFATRLLPEGRYRFRAESPDGRVASADLDVTGDAGPRLTLTLAQGSTVRGRIATGPSVKDLRAVSIRLLLGGKGEASVPAPSIDSSGEFALPGVPPGEHDLVVSLPGLAPVVLHHLLVPPEGGVVDVGVVLLGQGANLRVRVYGEGRGPLAGAAVAVEDTAGLRREEETNAGGLALFGGLAEGVHRVVVLLPSGGVLRRTVDMPGDGEREEVVDLGLVPAGTVEVLRAGGPVPGALVTVAFGDSTMEAVADDRGFARVPGLPEGPVLVVVTPPGEPTVHLRLSVANHRLSILLSADGIEGEVLAAATGKPVPGALVRVLPLAVEATADARGRFRFPSLPPGTHVLEATARGFGAARSAGVVVLRGGGATPARVLLEAAARAGGLVLDPAGRPVPGGIVEATDPATGDLLPGGRRSADAAGRYEFDNLPPGAFVLTARAGGLGASPPEVLTLGPGETRSLDLALLPGGTLEVRVVGPGGRPVPGALVSVHDFFGRVVPLDGDLTDVDGLLRVPGLRAGVYVVRASKGGLEAEVRVRVDVRGGSRAALALLPE